MHNVLRSICREDQGVLTFEWILLITLLIIGIVGGLSAVRDGVVDELGDVTEAIVNVDQSWSIKKSDCLNCNQDFGSYEDETPNVCRRRPGN